VPTFLPRQVAVGGSRNMEASSNTIYAYTRRSSLGLSVYTYKNKGQEGKTGPFGG
jgi:hypothetical protein